MAGLAVNSFSHPSVGDVIDNKYVVDALLSEGGIGAVVRAVHVIRRAPVALKFLNPKMLAVEGSHARFLREAMAASIIPSEHVVKVYDVGTLPSGIPYIVMELLEGVELAELVELDGRPGLPVPRAIHFTLQLLRALQLAHAAGVIHRDLKPSNCFIIQRDGEPDFLKVLDFGVSKVRLASEAVITRAGSALGTPVYMAPEQARSPRDADQRSDLFSVGVILYRLLSGRLPYDVENLQPLDILMRVMSENPVPLLVSEPSVPPMLAEVVHHAMAKVAADRYADAAAMAEALAPWADRRSARVLAGIREHRPDQLTTPSDVESLILRSATRPRAPPTLALPGSAPQGTSATLLAAPEVHMDADATPLMQRVTVDMVTAETDLDVMTRPDAPAPASLRRRLVLALAVLAALTSIVAAFVAFARRSR